MNKYTLEIDKGSPCSTMNLDTSNSTKLESNLIGNFYVNMFGVLG